MNNKRALFLKRWNSVLKTIVPASGLGICFRNLRALSVLHFNINNAEFYGRLGDSLA